MGKILTVAIHKGGTGKTTLVTHLALWAARRQLSVLVVDVDAQANTTHFFKADTVKKGSSQLFLENFTGIDYHQVNDRVYLLPGDENLFDIERLEIKAAQYFKNNIRRIAGDFDLVIVDTPPTMGFGMLAPLIASDFAISPVIPDAYSIAGVKGLFARIKNVRAKYNPRLNFLGLLINRWTSRNIEQSNMVKNLSESLKGHLISQTLGDRTAIANAAYRHKAVFDQPSGGAAQIAAKEMRLACDEILKKMNIGEK